jgi:hypothetical protein
MLRVTLVLHASDIRNYYIVLSARIITMVNSAIVSVNATPQLASGNSLLPMR